MLDLKRIRQEPELIRQAIQAKRESGVDLDGLLQADEQWRSALQELERLRAERNRVSEEVGRRKRGQQDAGDLIAAMRRVGERIKVLEQQVGDQESEIARLLLTIPNVPHPDVPDGDDENDNVELRRWNEPTTFDFEPDAHWDLGPRLGLFDFERATRVAGPRFTVFWGQGARLVRALTAFMIDLHTTEHGYLEVYPPLLVNRDSMIGTGQLPKFEDDAFRVERKDLFLVPTAEVPVTNLYRDEIIEAGRLPIALVAYTPCFRAEAGAAGRDTRGLIRQHQFDKVEMVRFVEPDDSYEQLESLVGHA
ncbi:MAG: serine--tRNA ligase, partial [Thermaerobacterales bacterium]